MRIKHAHSPSDVEVVRQLFSEYWNSFGFTPCFQGFADELTALPGRYVPPEGRLGLAFINEEAAGCIALRKLDNARAEMKRLYVRPGFRGHGCARALLDWLLAEARAAGYTEVVCDTMPVMSEALAMYRRHGFEETSPYTADPTPGAIYLRLQLP